MRSLLFTATVLSAIASYFAAETDVAFSLFKANPKGDLDRVNGTQDAAEAESDGQVCSSICVHSMDSAAGCDFYRLRERIPQLRTCITGEARHCPKQFSSYCYNTRQVLSFGLNALKPICDDGGYTCGLTRVSKMDLHRMNCDCSVKCKETCD